MAYKRDGFFIDTQIYCGKKQNDAEIERLENLGLPTDSIAAQDTWQLFSIDLRDVIAVRTPSDDGTPNMHETALHTSYDRFIVDAPYEEIKAIWKDARRSI